VPNWLVDTAKDCY